MPACVPGRAAAASGARLDSERHFGSIALAHHEARKAGQPLRKTAGAAAFSSSGARGLWVYAGAFVRDGRHGNLHTIAVMSSR